MKIDDMDAFVAVIRCQSTNLAAEALQLTQPAITRRVQNFEEDLGATLLDRNTKPLKPTPTGTRVYEQCRVILREMDALRELVATDAPPTGLLRLGVPQTIGDVVLLDALKHLRIEYPDLRAQVATGWGSQLVGKIERGELDAAAALFPAGKIFPDNVVGESIGKMELVVVCAALVGAGLGFLWFNTYPAQVFMGDVGSLALGAVLGVIAILVRQEIVLFIMGGVFVMETLSVILQVGSYKLRGQRIFRMAPIHHHYELKGWPEPRVIVRFWILSIIFVLVGLATLKLR